MAGLLAVYTYNYSIGRHKVLNSSTFLKELRVGGNIKFYLLSSSFQFLFYSLFYLKIGTHRNCTLNYQQSILFNVLAKLRCYVKNITEVCTSVLSGRSSNCNKYNVKSIQNFLQRCRKMEASV